MRAYCSKQLDCQTLLKAKYCPRVTAVSFTQNTQETMRPWPLTYDLVIQCASGGCQVTCRCKISTGWVQRFMSYRVNWEKLNNDAVNSAAVAPRTVKIEYVGYIRNAHARALIPTFCVIWRLLSVAAVLPVSQPQVLSQLLMSRHCRPRGDRLCGLKLSSWSQLAGGAMMSDYNRDTSKCTARDRATKRYITRARPSVCAYRGFSSSTTDDYWSIHSSYRQNTRHTM